MKDPPLSKTIAKQIGIYLLSALLPPFGLVPGIKYLRQKDDKSKMIGIAALVLTVLSSAVNIWLFFQLFNQLNSTVNSTIGF